MTREQRDAAFDRGWRLWSMRAAAVAAFLVVVVGSQSCAPVLRAPLSFPQVSLYEPAPLRSLVNPIPVVAGDPALFDGYLAHPDDWARLKQAVADRDEAYRLLTAQAADDRALCLDNDAAKTAEIKRLRKELAEARALLVACGATSVGVGVAVGAGCAN